MARIPADFAIALVLVLATNGLVGGVAGDRLRNDSRQLSHRLVESQIAALPSNALDLVIFGDSRGRQIDADHLCRLLYDRPRRCFNASSVAGDWVTTDLHLGALGDRVTPETVVLVMLSEYWLEMGGLERGLIPRTPEYAALGQPANAAASFFPLSRARGLWMQDLHRWLRLRGWWLLGRVTDARPPPSRDDRREAEMPEIAGWGRSHVDLWFSPISERDLRVREETARRVLWRLAAGGRRVVLVDLAKPPVRNDYVDRYFPGRRERYRASVERLRGELGLPFLELDGQFTAWSAYRDFHHFTDAVLPYVHGRLAASLRTLPGQGFSRPPVSPARRPPASRERERRAEPRGDDPVPTGLGPPGP